MAHECGIDFDLFDVAEIFKRTPYIADLKPGGQYVAKDVFDIGGVPQILKALLDGGFLHGDCLTVTGKTMAENLESREVQHRPEGHLPGLEPDHRRPAASSVSRARSRPTAPSSRSPA